MRQASPGWLPQGIVRQMQVSTRRRTPNPNAEESRASLRAVAKAIELLELLGATRQPQALAQLSSRVKLGKASALRVLVTLESTGYVLRDVEGRYRLRDDVRRSVMSKLICNLVEAATPHLRDLTRGFRETTGLAVLFENHIEVVAVVESPQSIRMGNTVGRILQPHASSLGKCITAWQTEELRDHLLRSYGINPITEHTITRETELYEEFAKIREQGYATDRGETCVEGYCFGAPVFNAYHEVFAAVSMSLPKMRLGDEEQQARIANAIRAAAESISRALAG